MIVDVRRAGISFICARAAVSSRRGVASMGQPPDHLPAHSAPARLRRRLEGGTWAPIARREGAAPSSAPRDAPKKTMCARNPVFLGIKKAELIAIEDAAPAKGGRLPSQMGRGSMAQAMCHLAVIMLLTNTSEAEITRSRWRQIGVKLQLDECCEVSRDFGLPPLRLKSKPKPPAHHKGCLAADLWEVKKPWNPRRTKAAWAVARPAARRKAWKVKGPARGRHAAPSADGRVVRFTLVEPAQPTARDGQVDRQRGRRQFAVALAIGPVLVHARALAAPRSRTFQ